MTSPKKHGKIEIADTIPGANTIERVAGNEWLVVQRHYGEGLDNAQNPSWLSAENGGAPAKVRVRIRWAEFRWMGLRRNIYIQRGKSYSLVQGQSTPTESVYEFDLPSGSSRFGPAPWYTNEDAARFIKRMTRRGPACRARSIGKTAEGRDIPCLTIDFGGRRKKKHVVITGRLHAFETAGSWAVEGTADWLLGAEAPKAWLDRYAFHLFPAVNPDGVANGLKQTRLGPVKLYDMEQGGVASDDATIRSFREEMIALKPHVLIDHHGYLFAPLFLYGFEKKLTLRVLADMLPEDDARKEREMWYYCLETKLPNPASVRGYCFNNFGTRVIVTELPWHPGRMPSDMTRLGARILQATMKSL